MFSSRLRCTLCVQASVGGLGRGARPGVSLLPYQFMAQSRAATLVGAGAMLRPARPRMSAAEAAQRCQVAMEGVARTQAHASATVGRRQKLAAEAQEGQKGCKHHPKALTPCSNADRG